MSKRTAPIEEDFKFILKSQVRLEIPEGFNPSFIPADKNIPWKNGLLESQYQVEGNQIIYTKKYISDFLILNHAEFADWNEFLQKLTEINQENVILTKSK